jgi:hypothetical protein
MSSYTTSTCNLVELDNPFYFARRERNQAVFQDARALNVEKAPRDTKPSAEHVQISREVCKNRLLQQRLFARMGEKIVTGSWNSPHMKVGTFKNDHYRRSRTKAGTNDDDIRAEEFAGY